MNLNEKHVADRLSRIVEREMDDYVTKLTELSDARKTIAALAAVLERIQTVCDDNAAATCRHDLALKFVRDVAALALEGSDGRPLSR